MDAKLQEIYYDPEHLWTGRKAIKLLQKASGLKPKIVKHWLYNQAIFQVHIKPPKHIDYPHYYVTEVNDIHQADLMYLTHDKVYQTTYKYVLNVIDIASRYKISRPLKTKGAKEVSEMLADIYKTGPLKYPKEFHVDNGGEFKAETLKLLKKNNVKVVSATTKYHHNFTGFIERFNKTLAERLYKLQDAQELENPKKDSRIWVKHLYKIVKQINNEETRMLGKPPAKAIKLENVTLKIKPYPEEKVKPDDGLYRYLYKPGELEDDDKRRATDMIWSWNTYRLDKIVKNPGQRVLYYLAEGPKRAFVSEELMLIPEATELPPDWVNKW